MDKPIENYWTLRLANVKETLEGNNFEVFIAENAESAKKIVLEQILPATGAKSVSWGGSVTFAGAGLYESLRNRPGLE